MDEAISMFMMVTEADENVARRYLGMTEGNLEQATTLFFDSPDLGASPVQATHEPPPIPRSTRPQQYTTGGDSAREAVEIDSDEDDMDFVDQDDQEATRAAAVGRAADYEDDEAIARRMQEELYASGGTDAEGVRAPIERTTETLVGGPGGDYGDDFSPAMQFLRNRAGRAEAQPGPFSQRADFRPGPSIWDDTERDAASQRSTFTPTPGNEVSAKQQRLAELFRPPFDMMYRGSWDGAREEGKEKSKWLLVNVQDMSIFDCQSLNRDIWKHQGIKELVQENFIFIQYSKDDPRGAPYINYYFQMKDSSAAYPHIAIVDPRTGEQVKVWSGPPGPKAPDFLMQLVEFLDRYSLDVTKKNPVAKRKSEKPKELDVDRLTEQEMLDLALQNSLAPGGTPGPKEHDPDDLTKSFVDTGKGKGKEIEGTSANIDETANGHGSTAATPFAQILSNNPHTEPVQAPDVTRIQFRHSDGRVIRRFNIHDPVRRLYEWLKAEPLAGKEGVEFELKSVGKDLIEYLDETIEDAGLKNQTVMVEFIEG